jgi:predicted phage tail protein
MGVQLECIETASAIYDWTTADEEDFLSGGELDLYDGRTVDNVTSLSLTEIGLRGPDGGVSSAVQLTWTAPDDAFIEYYKIRYNKNGTTDYFEVQSRETNVFISGLDITSNYDFRVQAENLLGVTSTGTTLSNQALNGDTTAPGVPTSPSATGGLQTITAEWTNPTDVDFKHTEVFVNTSDSIPATPTAIVDGEEYIVTGLSGSQTRYFWLKAVDFSGNKSAATASFNGTSSLSRPE